MSKIIEKLKDVVGAGRIMTGDSVAERPTSFWNHDPTRAKAIVLPISTDEVSAILHCCHDHEQSVVVQGGLTNCVAAAESTPDDVVLSLEKMTRIDEIDVIGCTAVVEAGAILQIVQETVAEQGLYFPLDLGARGSCTIGGNIATNAGGINVLRYGMMRNLVLGLEAVLADGTVISSMNRMLKNNAGYDLKQLFIGTEGTLGVVTRAVLRLFPQPASRQDAIVAMRDFDAVSAFLNHVQQQLAGTLSAFEIMWGDYFAAVTGKGGHRAPMSRDHPYYVVLQSEGGDPDAGAERFEAVLASALDEQLIVDAVIPKSAAEARAIWEIRENFEAILEPEPVYLYDVSLPIRDMDDYVADVKSNVSRRWPNGECYTIGHVADGNLHFFVQPNETGDFHDASDECVYAPLTAIGGSVSAEHGIGTEKLNWLSHSRSATEIELMRTLKKNLDPKNLLNPGRVFTRTH
ncbi:MAG: FAD-binding oxidoreductase [Proteobacteria bacterium]|nr:FAD-binding oxidoreductase [Pseudomonadota bacterium]